VNRREFLERVERVSAGAAACGLTLSLGGCLRFNYVSTTLAGNRLLVFKEEIGDSRFVLVQPPGYLLPLYLYRLTDDSWSAVSTRCMHRGCQVEPVADHLICPCHGSEYTNTGDVLKGPTQLPLRRFVVTVEGDRLAIELPLGGDAP
jgi:cytochrome b6-f complex iron-sulfur subunit